MAFHLRWSRTRGHRDAPAGGALVNGSPCSHERGLLFCTSPTLTIQGRTEQVLSVPTTGFDFCRVDHEFNGFCYTAPFAPILTDITPTVLPYDLAPTTINFVEGTTPILPEPASYRRTNICFSTGAREASPAPAVTLAPNPASDHFRLFVPTDHPQRAELFLRNALGSVHGMHRVEVVPDRSLVVDASGLPAGAYVVEVRIGTFRRGLCWLSSTSRVGIVPRPGPQRFMKETDGPSASRRL